MTICWPCHAHTPRCWAPENNITALSGKSMSAFSLLSLSLSLFLFLCDFCCSTSCSCCQRHSPVRPLPLDPPIFLVPVRRKVPPERIAVRHKLLYFIVQFLFIIFLGYFSRCVLLLMLHLLFRFPSDFFLPSYCCYCFYCCCCCCCCRALCGTCWQLDRATELRPNWTKLGRHSHCRFVGNCFLKIKHTRTRSSAKRKA